MQTRFDEIGLDAADTVTEMVTDQNATRRPGPRRPPANPEHAFVEIAEDLVAELAPDRYVDLKRSGETTLSGFSDRILLTQTLDISTCHRRFHRPRPRRPTAHWPFIVVLVILKIEGNQFSSFRQRSMSKRLPG
jgi:hypothetical protein